MNSYIQTFLEQRQYVPEVNEQAVLRVLFGGEDPSQVMEDLGIHDIYTINNCLKFNRLYFLRILFGAVCSFAGRMNGYADFRSVLNCFNSDFRTRLCHE